MDFPVTQGGQGAVGFCDEADVDVADLRFVFSAFHVGRVLLEDGFIIVFVRHDIWSACVKAVIVFIAFRDGVLVTVRDVFLHIEGCDIIGVDAFHLFLRYDPGRLVGKVVQYLREWFSRGHFHDLVLPAAVIGVIFIVYKA